MSSLSVTDIQIGDTLPELCVVMNAQKIISGAAATRDWQPIHHDHDLAIKSGLRGIIVNAPTQAGWISKYITDWAGARAQIKRLSFRMKDSICPGDDMTLRGEITGKEEHGQTTATVTVTVDGKTKTVAQVVFSLPG